MKNAIKALLNKTNALVLTGVVVGAGATYGGITLYNNYKTNGTNQINITDQTHQYGSKFGRHKSDRNKQGMHGDCNSYVNTLPKQDLSKQEIEDIMHMREEEKLARDIYLALYEKWGIQAFKNIANSEQRHMDAIKSLIDKYNLNDPVTNDKQGVFTDKRLQELYTQLVNQGSKSEVEALKVGATIEDLDIYDLNAAIQKTDNQDIKYVYNNLRNGSYHHMQAFVGLLNDRGENYKPQYITQEEFNKIMSGELGKRGGNHNHGSQRNTPRAFNKNRRPYRRLRQLSNFRG